MNLTVQRRETIGTCSLAERPRLPLPRQSLSGEATTPTEPSNYNFESSKIYATKEDNNTEKSIKQAASRLKVMYIISGVLALIIIILLLVIGILASRSTTAASAASSTASRTSSATSTASSTANSVKASITTQPPGILSSTNQVMSAAHVPISQADYIDIAAPEDVNLNYNTMSTTTEDEDVPTNTTVTTTANNNHNRTVIIRGEVFNRSTDAVLMSANMRYGLYYDGVARVKRIADQSVIWQTYSPSQGTAMSIQQVDGNWCLQDGGWCAYTHDNNCLHGDGAHYMQITNNGQLILMNSRGYIIWMTLSDSGIFSSVCCTNIYGGLACKNNR